MNEESVDLSPKRFKRNPNVSVAAGPDDLRRTAEMGRGGRRLFVQHQGRDFRIRSSRGGVFFSGRQEDRVPSRRERYR